MHSCDQHVAQQSFQGSFPLVVFCGERENLCGTDANGCDMAPDNVLVHQVCVILTPKYIEQSYSLTQRPVLFLPTFEQEVNTQAHH